MSEYPPLNFPAVRLRAVERGGKLMVRDDLRGMYLVLTPEEWVRRHLVAYLVSDCNAQPLRIVQEYPVPLNGCRQRADVVVVNDDARPVLLVECKAPDVAIGDDVLSQAVRYNSVLQARYVVLTNGMVHYCYEYDGASYLKLSGFPFL